MSPTLLENGPLMSGQDFQCCILILIKHVVGVLSVQKTKHSQMGPDLETVSPCTSDVPKDSSYLMTGDKHRIERVVASNMEVPTQEYAKNPKSTGVSEYLLDNNVLLRS